MMAKKKNARVEFIKWFGPVLNALRNLGGSAKPREIAQWIGEEYKIPEEVLNERYTKSKALKFPNQIAWARQYLVWEGLLESSKHGVWNLTSTGWNAKLNENQAHDIFIKWVKIFQDLRDNKETVDKVTERVVKIQEVVEPEEGQSIINPTLLEVLQSVSPTGFEHLCGRLLKEYNFENIEITQRSNDGGIDGYATLKLGNDIQIYTG
jgi:restriction system protein